MPISFNKYIQDINQVDINNDELWNEPAIPAVVNYLIAQGAAIGGNPAVNAHPNVAPILVTKTGYMDTVHPVTQLVVSFFAGVCVGLCVSNWLI